MDGCSLHVDSEEGKLQIAQNHEKDTQRKKMNQLKKEREDNPEIANVLNKDSFNDDMHLGKISS